ncbi:DinB family protein [Rubrivirga sp. S365]|uniref:DinB family protein n=1 Tax=Rubrivirga litoralis TaxID=3075598 RepID=A0ABU3BQM4_9BACT|nr:MULTISPECIES: DinB family protein [unclassified Rubrivirga]MDT0631590.1 DinB family protein [Rubrivirga sp. F394]MDT7857235.1 DinB family protein [Rubrivirga sp. S365]
MDTLLTPDQLLDHWLGHRRLTRRTIEAFPSDDAFTSFSVGEMRPFAGLVGELLSMSVPTLTGVVSGEWPMEQATPPATRERALARWDADTERIEELWPQIPDGRFQEVDTAFGQWTMPVWELLFYVVDNEVHHRGQAYVFLRALGVEPPAFPDRA